jgi:hypothetical protein
MAMAARFLYMVFLYMTPDDSSTGRRGSDLIHEF